MKNLNYKELIAFANAFVSFVLPKIDVDEIILFGSAARNEATKESDIDIFFNTKNEKTIETIIENELERFNKSKIAEIWRLKGIKNEISIKVGNLNQWKLKRSVISDGIVLYGKYREMPENMRGFTYFNIKPIKDIAKRNKIIRQLFGRKEKNYSTFGFLDKINGKQLTPNSFLAPIEKTQEILKILNAEKINYSFFEFWTDKV